MELFYLIYEGSHFYFRALAFFVTGAWNYSLSAVHFDLKCSVFVINRRSTQLLNIKMSFRKQKYDWTPCFRKDNL